jgi:hypothetical protein
VITASTLGVIDAGGLAIAIALAAVVVSAVAIWVTFGQKREETLMTTLGWMEGGTQKRAIGVAAIEYWLSLAESKPVVRLSARSRVLVIRVLFSTAVYLLTASKQGGSTQELDNLARIMDILLHRVDRANPQYSDRFPLLLRAVADARAPRPETPGKEWLKVRTSDLDRWERVLRTIVPEQESAE